MCNKNQIRASTQLPLTDKFHKSLKVPASSSPEPRAMKWERNGELAHRDLSELVNRLLDVESQSNSNELSRLGTKYDNQE